MTVLVMIEAKAYSFQDNKKANIAAAPIPGPARGVQHSKMLGILYNHLF